jgi:hypothetical protein
VTTWSGVIDVEYGTIVLAAPGSPPGEDLDVGRLMEEKCATIPGGCQLTLPDKNPRVPTEIRVIGAPEELEEHWEHVAEVGMVVPGGRLQVYTWIPDEDLAGEIDVPPEPLVARIQWAGLEAWLRHAEAGRHEQAGDDVRVRVDLMPGDLDGVRTIRMWQPWAPPIHESLGANGLHCYRGVAVGPHRARMESSGRTFRPPYPTTDEGVVTGLLRDPADGSRWASGSGGSWSYPFLQQLTTQEADDLEALGYVPIETFARDALGRIWYAAQTPVEHATVLRYIPPDAWRNLQELHRHLAEAGGYRLVDLPDGWSRITRFPFDGSTRHVLVTELEGEGTDAFYQRWRDGAEIPS